MTRGEPGPRTEHHPVGVQDRRDGLRHGRRVARHHLYGEHLARGQCHRGLPADGVHVLGAGRVVPPDQGLELQRDRRHRQHPALRAEQLADQVEGLDGVAELFPQGDDQQVADRVPVQVALGLETVLDDPGPGLAPVVVTAQRGQGLAQVAGRQRRRAPPGAGRWSRRRRRR